MYTFHADGEDEVSVAAGERVRVQMDLGDWYHIKTQAGEGHAWQREPIPVAVPCSLKSGE